MDPQRRLKVRRCRLVLADRFVAPRSLRLLLRPPLQPPLELQRSAAIWSRRVVLVRPVAEPASANRCAAALQRSGETNHAPAVQARSTSAVAANGREAQGIKASRHRGIEALGERAIGYTLRH